MLHVEASSVDISVSGIKNTHNTHKRNVLPISPLFYKNDGEKGRAEGYLFGLGAHDGVDVVEDEGGHVGGLRSEH